MNEFTKNPRAAFLDRMRFHNGLSIEDAMILSGLCRDTVKKHLTKLVNDNLAVEDSEDHFKAIPKKYPWDERGWEPK
jgi:hypothetical protein